MTFDPYGVPGTLLATVMQSLYQIKKIFYGTICAGHCTFYAIALYNYWTKPDFSVLAHYVLRARIRVRGHVGMA